jgi:hypothetical protein
VSSRIGNAVSTAVILGIVLLVEAVGLRSGTVGYVLVGLVAAIALVLIAFRVNLQWMGLGAACGAAFSLTWNGWFLGPARPGDALIFIALACFVAGEPNRAFSAPPWWVKQLVFVIAIGVIAQVYFPPSNNYLTTRVTTDAGGKSMPPRSGDQSFINIGVGLKFIVAVAIIPLIFIAATRVDRRALRWLVRAFAVGTALSAWVAFTDYLGTNFGQILTRVPKISNRQLGFSDHPNFLAAGIVIAIPFAFYLAFSDVRRDRLLGWWSLPGMVLGVFASGSRGGAVCVLVALAACVVLHPRTRGSAPTIAIAALVVVGGLSLAFPSFGAEILRVTRLKSSPITQGSDEVRAINGAQGVRDFHYHPFTGIGLQASTDASQVYLQELASGGLLLFIGMCVYLLGGVWSAFRSLKLDPLAGMVLASLVTTIALNFVETDLTDRFYYLPAAILIAFLDVRRREGRVAAGDELEPAALTA